MNKNIGTRDRIIRALLGIICVVGLFSVQLLWLKIIIGILALFCFFQALFSWCLWYQIIEKNTCPVE